MKKYFVKYKTQNTPDATQYGININSDSIADAEKQAKDQLGSSAIIISIIDDSPNPISFYDKALLGLIFIALAVGIWGMIRSINHSN